MDWKLTAEAAYLSNFVYNIHEPQRPNDANSKRLDSWKSYIPFSSSDVQMDNNSLLDSEEDETMFNQRFCGPPGMDFESDPLWRQHSNKHSENLSNHGFELLDYAVTRTGQSVQWMITRSYTHANTIYLIFKGTSNPL